MARLFMTLCRSYNGLTHLEWCDSAQPLQLLLRFFELGRRGGNTIVRGSSFGGILKAAPVNLCRSEPCLPGRVRVAVRHPGQCVRGEFELLDVFVEIGEALKGLLSLG